MLGCEARLSLRRRLLPTIWPEPQSCGRRCCQLSAQAIDEAKHAREDGVRQRRLGRWSMAIMRACLVLRTPRGLRCGRLPESRRGVTAGGAAFGWG